MCHEVIVEPDQQPITGESFGSASTNIQDRARLDIAMNGFWGGRHDRSFRDVRIFNTHVAANRASNLASTHRKHEQLKKSSYKQRILQVEHASFMPLVFSAIGGLGGEANTFYKGLASLLTHKWNDPYNSTLAWLQCRLSFSLLH